MIDPDILGLAIMGLGALIVAWLVLRVIMKERRVFWFAVALIAVGLGYLSTTEAPRELVQLIFGNQAWLAVT